MDRIKLDYGKLSAFVSKDELKAAWPLVERAVDKLKCGTGEGNDFLGWVDLPVNYDKEEFDRIKKAAGCTACGTGSRTYPRKWPS